ncbi:MAG: hypothetical protein HRO68_10080 [Nitrosopumilus sp.]|nr:hypothetical protein [Nitrosopumilus sp.]
MAHQTSKQIDDKLFEIIVGNAKTQFVGTVSGMDGRRFGAAWDPDLTTKLQSQLATQEQYHWTARINPPIGTSQPVPIPFWPVWTDNEKQTKEFMMNFIASEKERYGYGVVGPSIFARNSSTSNDWLKSSPMEPPIHDEWLIYCILRNNVSLGQVEIVEKFKDGTIPREIVAKILKKMTDEGNLTKSWGNKGKYSLSSNSKRFFDYSSEKIGSAKDILDMIKIVTEHYISKGMFIVTVSQKVRKGKYRTDFVGYDYLNDSPISIEVESNIESASHPEHLRFNMKKWKDMGFSECHVCHIVI